MGLLLLSLLLLLLWLWLLCVVVVVVVQNNMLYLAPFPEPPFSPDWLGFIPPAKRSPRPGGPATLPPPFPFPGAPGGPLANMAARPAGPFVAATPFSSFSPSAS